ncbi:MAG TPA: hypothetical protein VFP84_37985 [Kofleriaceae bacterium]|nr:hypothetical protein [Kofleriaceae bacterium]
MTTAAAEPQAKPAAPRAFERMRGLIGNWVAALPNGKPYRVSFRLIAGDSALVETYTTASGKETMTIFTLDGDRLLATHYCAQGNQPRLALRGEGDGPLAFDFVDVTSLRDPASSHLRHLELAVSRDELIETEVYRSAGKDEAERFVFKRAP